jgi:DNA-binding LacI/PurR family transcriptional regulator
MSSTPPRRPTITDVALAAGVSTATVSNALNQRRYVDAGTAERIRAAASRLGYTPNASARRLRTGRVNTLALLSSMPFSVAAGPSRLGFMMEIAAVAAAVAIENGLALLLAPPPQAAKLDLSQLDIDGALIIEPADHDPALRHFAAQNIPVVCIGLAPGGGEVAVDLQSGATAILLLEHLREQGARHIALMVGSSARTSYLQTWESYRGFCAAVGMVELGIRIDEAGGEQAGYTACHALLAAHPEVDGICALVDAFAVGALRAVLESGRRVPEDVRLVTRYDGLRARGTTPPLTAVDLHLDAVAAAAIEVMLDLLEGRPPRQPTLTPPTLVPRPSSVMPAGFLGLAGRSK